MKNSPYLDKPFIPLAVALTRTLERIEAELATAGRGKAEAPPASPIGIRDLLKPRRRSPPPL